MDTKRDKTSVVTVGYPYFSLGLPLSRAAWEEFDLTEILEAADRTDGPRDRYAARLLADRMGERLSEGQKPVYAGEMMTLGVILDVLRYVVDHYVLTQQPGAMHHALQAVEDRRGFEIVEPPIGAFSELFPSEEVLEGERSLDSFRTGRAGSQPSREVVSREMILLFLTLNNPAAAAYRPLYDDAELREAAPYLKLVGGLEDHFEAQPPVVSLGVTLFSALRAPMVASPYDLDGQLRYILDQWTAILPEALRRRLLLVRGILREEWAMRGHVVAASPDALRFGPGLGLAGAEYPEPERFSFDPDWMSNVVLIAKSTYVWLDQLSRRYQRDICRLDQIPDEELDRLARWGFTGLWLIGVWERSPASEKIKRMMGNPEAMASAYSLYDYVIAADLGGEDAVMNLKGRCKERGIHLASDMVPNHVGLFSRWLVEHPDWFIQSRTPPYPGYRFTGESLSWDERVGIQLEDGYWNHSDAAVVFKRIDRWSGDERFIYHGNDGTHMPWNDTAQLNYLLPEVREAVIQTILYVARQFQIIRFDAAMTLAKKHYQRLWFPLPGEGGAIPSRAERGMTRAEFDEHIPEEFWREVVDRVAAEAPDTLLLAEAFWLMEGYFVRTLGMHRVYNSAFMNMLKLEENSKYRTTIKNVLEFSPEILKRFVNFMNNPDEKTAIEQFGKGDKYFGVCMLMVTMPGLPMFGHGQIDGHSEKYGMEYRRAYWDEPVDWELVARHEREIFPLMHHRRLFSGVDNFALYDFFAPEGHVDENVLAFSNRADQERALVLYNNAYARTRGWIRRSTAINVGRQDQTCFVHRTLDEALGLRVEPHVYYIFRDHRTGFEYLRQSNDIAENGLYFEMNGYEYFVLMDWREVYDTDGSWSDLAHMLGGRGVASIERAHKEMVYAPLVRAYHHLFSAEVLFGLVSAMMDREHNLDEMMEELETPLAELFSVARRHGFDPGEPGETLRAMRADLELFATFDAALGKSRLPKAARDYLLAPWQGEVHPQACFWSLPVVWALVRRLEPLLAPEDGRSGAWMDEWMLSPVLRQSFSDIGCDDWRAEQLPAVLGAMLEFVPRGRDTNGPDARLTLPARMFDHPGLRAWLTVNLYDGVWWYNQEQYEQLLYWIYMADVVNRTTDRGMTKTAGTALLGEDYDTVQRARKAAEETGYQVEGPQRILSKAPASKKKAATRKTTAKPQAKAAKKATKKATKK